MLALMQGLWKTRRLGEGVEVISFDLDLNELNMDGMFSNRNARAQMYLLLHCDDAHAIAPRALRFNLRSGSVGQIREHSGESLRGKRNVCGQLSLGGMYSNHDKGYTACQ
jgi:hypothetical protein